jgi:hypothetical protein
MAIETFGLDHNFIVKCLNRFAVMLEINLPENICIFVDDTIRVNGACYQNDHDDYMIVLKIQDEEGDMVQTLAHEMVHVKQFLKDDLASLFRTDIPYMERWWEIEAYKKEIDLMKDLIAKVESGSF